MFLRKMCSIILSMLVIVSISCLGWANSNATTIDSTISLLDNSKMLLTQTDFFTENKGQWDESILFVGNTAFGKVAFTKEAVYYQIAHTETNPAPVSSLEKDPLLSIQQQDKQRTFYAQTIKLSFVNGQTPKLTGKNTLPHYYNYFIGNDKTKWASNCRNYSKVYYENIWEGIDLAYFFTPEGMKYEYYVEPTADVNQLQIKVEGAEITNSGNSLEIASVLGKIQDSNLLVFDQTTRLPIQAGFSVVGNTYSFQGIPKERKNTVVIDPLVYSTYLGGSNVDFVYSIQVDQNGNAYVVGGTYSTDFPVSPGAFVTVYKGNSDCFVSKLNPTGTALLYSTYIGGTNADDVLYSIQIDALGNAFLAGYTYAMDYPVTPGAFMTTRSGSADATITKLNPTGTALVYSTYLGGSGSDIIYSIQIDVDGNAYVTGYTYSTNFPVTIGAFMTTPSGGMTNGFVTKLNPTGTALQYSTYLGGNTDEVLNSIKVDTLGNAFITGFTNSADFPVTPGAYMTTYNGDHDVFITKLNSTGTGLIYSTFLGGSWFDFAYSIAIDSTGCAYVTGYTYSTDFPVTPGVFMTTAYNGWTDCFVTKINPTGTALIYSTHLGGADDDYCYSITVDSIGNAYIGGYTRSTDFPVTPGAYSTVNSGGWSDDFITKLNSTGTALLYSTYLGGNGEDNLSNITVDASGNAYIVGYTTIGNFPVTPGAFMTLMNGPVDGFITKLSIIDVVLTGELDFNEVNLQWSLINQGNETINKYKLYRADVADGIYQLLSTVFASGNISFNDSTGEPGKTYSYYVEALYMNDLPAAESNRVIVGPIQSVIVTLTGSVQYNESHLNWIVQNPVAIPIFGYRIYRGLPDEFLYVIDFVSGDSIHSYIDKNVTIGKYYLYAVEAMATNDQPLVMSNQILLGPIQALPDPVLDLSIELNKHEFCYGDDVLYKVTAYNTSVGPANLTKLQITLPREIQYSSADKYRGEVQPGGIVIFNLGTIPGKASVTFQINATVSARTSVMKSAATFFYVSCLEEVFAETVAYTTIKSCDGGNPIPYIRVVLLNTQFDPETGERYINKDSELSMDISIDGFTAPFRYEVIWGDGEKNILKDQTEKKLNFTHRYTSGGSMEIQVNVTDTSGKSKTVSVRIKVK